MRSIEQRGVKKGPTRSEGYVPFRGYRTWYCTVGESAQRGKLPPVADLGLW
jgi:hypothetical protein